MTGKTHLVAKTHFHGYYTKDKIDQSCHMMLLTQKHFSVRLKAG